MIIILAVWYMDDGNIIKMVRFMVTISTQSFGKRENIILSQTLNDVYGIEYA